MRPSQNECLMTRLHFFPWDCACMQLSPWSLLSSLVCSPYFTQQSPHNLQSEIQLRYMLKVSNYNLEFLSSIEVITVLWHPSAWHYTTSGQLNLHTPPSPPLLIALLMESLARRISLSQMKLHVMSLCAPPTATQNDINISLLFLN